MIYIVELVVETRVVVRLGAEDIALLCRIDLDAGARKLIEDTRSKRAPEIAVEGARLKHLICSEILEHRAVEEDARCIDCDAIEVGEGGLGCTSRRGGECTASRRKRIECTDILLRDHFIARDQRAVQIADQKDIVVSFFAHSTPMPIR